MIEPRKYNATKIAQFLDISVGTLNVWYKWYEDERFEKPAGIPKLPPYEQAGPRRPRYWSEDVLLDLKRFKNWLPKGRGGVMGDLNARNWGERGRQAQKNKALRKAKAQQEAQKPTKNRPKKTLQKSKKSNNMGD